MKCVFLKKIRNIDDLMLCFIDMFTASLANSSVTSLGINSWHSDRKIQAEAIGVRGRRVKGSRTAPYHNVVFIFIFGNGCLMSQ